MTNSIKKIIKRNYCLFLFLKQGLLYARYLKSLWMKGKYEKSPRYKVVDCYHISEKEKHCYFGYYDKSPFDSKVQRVIFLKVKENAKEGDFAELCLYDMQTKMQQTFGITCAWNWQQGCMEQWVNDDIVSYNSYNEETGDYQAVLHHILRNEDRVLHRAAYTYNKLYSKFLSLNFYRLDKYAKGYGYPYKVDSMDEKDDGIWEVDVEHDAAELILSLKDVMDYEAKDYMDCQHYINHVAYCPDERYIIFIHRWQEKGGTFISRLIKFDTEQRVMMTLLDNGHVSHYCWKSDDELLIYATNCQKEKGYMILNIFTGETHMVEGLPDEDGHPSYSNDRKWILTDTYPDYGRKQYLFLFNVEEKRLMALDILHSPIKYFNENRCDLHPRWSKDNKYVCVDNTSTGLRSLKIYKIA